MASAASPPRSSASRSSTSSSPPSAWPEARPMFSDIRPAIVSTILLTLLLGLGYPLAITGVAQIAFPYQANGSLVTDKAGHVIGSALLAQPFAKDEYLHPRPSAAGSNGYDPTASGGSNYGPLSGDLAKRIAADA